jgi:hypothetical protein
VLWENSEEIARFENLFEGGVQLTGVDPLAWLNVFFQFF